MRIKSRVKELIYNFLKLSGILKIKNSLIYSRENTWCTILLYHRVDGDIENDPIDINISPEEFRNHIEIFAKNYNVISLKEMLEHLENKKPFLQNTICISFDDSYLSIYENAFPVLKEYNVPACFFINDGYVETERIYPWDAEYKLNPPMMRWDQLKEMSDAGFEIGVHTTNHVNLGKCSLDEAEREISQSKKVLEERTGVSIPFFSFPFGRSENFNVEIVDILKKNNLSCCFSGHGGIVNLESDFYYINRLPYSGDYSSITEFRADIDQAFSFRKN